MPVYKFIAKKDNTITNAFKEGLYTRATGSNMGESDSLEVFSIYAQANTASLEKSRILVDFPVDSISSKRAAANIPESGSINFYLRMFNAEHSYTLPKKYHLSIAPVLQEWDEGIGLDMETYTDADVSNWVVATGTVNWYQTGATFPDNSRLAAHAIPSETKQYVTTGTEDLEVDITAYVEEWIKDHKGTSTAAVGEIHFPGLPDVGETITLFSTENDYRVVQMSTSSVTSGKTIYVDRQAAGSVGALLTAISGALLTDPNPIFVTSTPTSPSNIAFTQKVKGYFGNTKITHTFPVNYTITNFANGTGIVPNGLSIKMSGSAEDGSLSRSFYTKKFFARGSEFFFKRPSIEARWDDSIKDDRGNIIKSSSLAPGEDNLNNIYLYNKVRGQLRDIPDIGSNLVVQLLSGTTPGAAAETLPLGGGVVSGLAQYITASRVSAGTYKAQFAYTGSHTSLYDVWLKSVNDNNVTTLFTGSLFSVAKQSPQVHREALEYTFNITNLKKSYTSVERPTLRVYTRNKKWKPNIYAKASAAAPVTTVRESYYKLKRVADNLTVIPYSTGSSVQFSRLSYDVSGSFFDLDMSILEPNYLYEIRFLFNENGIFKEQREKFRFRVDS